MAREEEKRQGLAAEQVAKREAMAKVRAIENEKVQREQWSRSAGSGQVGKPKIEDKAFLKNVPVPVKKKMAKSFEAEDEARKKFMQDVEQASQTNNQPQQKSIIK
jgi:hypothetical protein